MPEVNEEEIIVEIRARLIKEMAPASEEQARVIEGLTAKLLAEQAPHPLPAFRHPIATAAHATSAKRVELQVGCGRAAANSCGP